jgi:hypothetical protein
VSSSVRGCIQVRVGSGISDILLQHLTRLEEADSKCLTRPGVHLLQQEGHVVLYMSALKHTACKYIWWNLLAGLNIQLLTEAAWQPRATMQQVVSFMHVANNPAANDCGPQRTSSHDLSQHTTAARAGMNCKQCSSCQAYVQQCLLVLQANRDQMVNVHTVKSARHWPVAKHHCAQHRLLQTVTPLRCLKLQIPPNRLIVSSSQFGCQHIYTECRHIHKVR